MLYEYETIKNLAKQNGRKVTDYLALAPGNDPFYVGTPADVKAAQWFADIWNSAGYVSGVHLRRVHYWAVSQNPPVVMPDGKPYENTDKCWDFIVAASKKARYLGMVQIEQIIDNKNPQPHIHARYSANLGARDDEPNQPEPSYEIYLPDLTAPHIWVYGLDHIDIQPYHLEIWCEKSTMNDVLLPLGQKYNANIVTFEGEVSITACYALVQRIKASGRKPTRIWYISDFDPAGNSMPAAMSRKVEYLLEDDGNYYDVKIKPALLTADQVRQYKLPRIPIKETEKRSASFEAAFGRGAVELDALEALHPGRLQALLARQLATYYSPDAKREAEQAEAALRAEIGQKIDEITAQYLPEIERLKQMFTKIRAIQVDATRHTLTQHDPHVEESNNWLFDSNRNYTDQIAHYKQHKGIVVQVQA